MALRIGKITIVVTDYDEAINFYTKKLGFALTEDTVLSPAKRWVVIAPDKQSPFQLLLAKAVNPEQQSRAGNQTGGRIFLFLYTDDFVKDYNRLLKNEVEFIRPPVKELYGTVAVFKDLYGNLWDLIEEIEINR